MRASLVLSLALTLASVACSRPPEQRTFTLQGQVQSLDVPRKLVTVKHEEIAGFMVMNDFSARDIQRKEMRVGLGPAKAKDFATSFGPVLVTRDEFDGTSGVMTARVNGEERSRGDLADMHYSWRQILDRASRNTQLRPGDVIGSGTVGSGSILEHDDGRWLTRGDVVELEIEGLGTLRNRIA